MIHSTFVNTSLIPLISGRGKKNIMLIESTTRTAIYFPPTFNGVYGYVPENCGGNRHADQIFITGQTREEILQAELRLTEIVSSFHKPSTSVDANL